jgi:hypothetical protein
LEIEFAGSGELAGGQCHVGAPSLVAPRIEEMAWTIALPPGYVAGSMPAGLAENAKRHWVDGREVISLKTSGADGHGLWLPLEHDARDSLSRRVLVLVVLLVSGGGLIWATERFAFPRLWLVWLGVPSGIAWWFWLRPSILGIVIAAVAAGIGTWFVLQRGRSAREPLPPTAPPLTEEPA